MPVKDDNEGGNDDEDQTGVSPKELTEHQAITKLKTKWPLMSKRVIQREHENKQLL